MPRAIKWGYDFNPNVAMFTEERGDTIYLNTNYWKNASVEKIRRGLNYLSISLNHEELHLALEKVGETRASEQLDSLFGYQFSFWDWIK